MIGRHGHGDSRRKAIATKTERRQIVEETLKSGVSVSQVARAHDVNTNLVFHWRRQYRAGWFDDVARKATALVPVKIVRSAGESLQATARKAKAKVSNTPGSIDIDLGHARVRIKERPIRNACERH